MLNITHYQRNANQNHNEVPSHAGQNGCYQKSTNDKCWRGCREKGTLLHCWWECKLVQPLWRMVWRFLKKLEIELQQCIVKPSEGKENVFVDHMFCVWQFKLLVFKITTF